MLPLLGRKGVGLSSRQLLRAPESFWDVAPGVCPAAATGSGRGNSVRSASCFCPEPAASCLWLLLFLAGSQRRSFPCKSGWRCCSAPLLPREEGQGRHWHAEQLNCVVASRRPQHKCLRSFWWLTWHQSREGWGMQGP